MFYHLSLTPPSHGSTLRIESARLNNEGNLTTAQSRKAGGVALPNAKFCHAADFFGNDVQMG
jgi:hypothetical protein